MSTKILYVVPGSFLLYYRLRDHIRFLKSKGFEIEVVCAPDLRAAEAAEWAGVAYHPLALRPDPSPFHMLRELRALCGVMRGRKFDIVYCCTKKGGLISSVAAGLCGVPNVVYVVHGLHATRVSHFEKFLHLQLDRFISHLSEKVICISRSNLEIFSHDRICKREKLVLIGEGSDDGVDVDHFRLSEHIKKEAADLRRTTNIPANAFVLGFVGRLDITKGIRELVAAWKLIREKHDSVHLAILAPPEIDPSLALTLEALCRENRVHLLGFMKDPVVGYALMNCILLPSYSEGFGNVILEAGSMELPVIATRVAGCVDAVVDNWTGLLVEPRSATDLARGIERILGDPERARQWGKNGRERCVQLFRRELVWQGYADLYDSLVGFREGHESKHGFVKVQESGVRH